MTLSTPTRLRIPIIKQGLLKGLNYEQIGTTCGVTEKTIDRDMHAWVQSGQFETWIKTEFVELHSHERLAHPLEAYKEVAKLVGKMITRKTEIKSEHKEEIKIGADINILLQQYETVIERVANRNLPQNNLKQQVDSRKPSATST